MTIEHPGSRRLTPVAKVLLPLTRLRMAKLQAGYFQSSPLPGRRSQIQNFQAVA